MSPAAWPHQEVIYRANKLFLGGLHGDPLAGGQPEQLEAGGGKTHPVLVSQLWALVPALAVGQEMGSFVWFVIDKALSKDKS